MLYNTECVACSGSRSYWPCYVVRVPAAVLLSSLPHGSVDATSPIGNPKISEKRRLRSRANFPRSPILGAQRPHPFPPWLHLSQYRIGTCTNAQPKQGLQRTHCNRCSMQVPFHADRFVLLLLGKFVYQYPHLLFDTVHRQSIHQQ
jgi:hypothetical protein